MKMEKFYQLKQMLRWQSVNEIKCIEPENLRIELKMDRKEFCAFADTLYKEGLIRYKYKFQCDNCGEDCVEYEKNLLKGKGKCEDCGKRFSLEEVRGFGHIVYELDYDGILELEEEELERAIAAPGGEMKEMEEEMKKMDNDKKKVIFFGSSKEATDTMDEIAALVSSMGYETLTWNSPNGGVFMAGNTTLENLIVTAKRVNGAIFIFNDDDKIWCRDEVEGGTVRDNVLFEYGLFMGTLEKSKVIFVSKNKPRLASDLAGVTYISADKGEAEIRQDLKLWLKRKL